MSASVLIEAVEAEGFGGGGVVAPAFGDVQVAGVFDGRDDGSPDVRQVDGPAARSSCSRPPRSCRLPQRDLHRCGDQPADEPGLAVVQGLAGTGLLRPVVVLGLGTNGTVTTSQIRQLLASVGPHHTLVLVNTFDPRPWQNGDNRVLAAAARKHDNVVLANWFAAIEHRTGLLWDDDVIPALQERRCMLAWWQRRCRLPAAPAPTASSWSATCHIP